MSAVGTQPVLRISDLTVGLPRGGDRAAAVAGASFELMPGRITCVVGESGSGKSVTARAIMGLLPEGLRATGGSILFEGRNLLEATPEALRGIRGRKIAMVFQEPSAALNPVRTIGDQVAEMILAHEKCPPDALERRVVEQLASVGLPDPAVLQHSYPFRLSGGQQQRVMIAIALALKPAVLIADEPTTALDVTTQQQILALIRTLQAQSGMAIMLVTHDFGVVAEMADQIVVMRQGQVVEVGAANDILRKPREAYTKALIAAVPRMTTTPRAPVEGAPLLTAQDVSKTYVSGTGLFRKPRELKAVDAVSFTLRRGETLGIVGESGSGKSTLARCIIRLVQPDAGQVDIEGIDFLALKGRALGANRHRMQMVFQDPYASINPRRTIGDIVTAPMRVQGASADQARRRAVELLQRVGIKPEAMSRYPHEFSGGQRQRIGIARALMLEPQVLIADEAVSSLDVSIQAQVLQLLSEIKTEFGLAMLFITHDLRVAAQICDRVMVMRRGQVVETGPADQVFGAPAHDYTRALLQAIPGRAWLAEEGAA